MRLIWRHSPATGHRVYTLTKVAAAGALVAALSLPATAQDREDQSTYRDWQQDRQRQTTDEDSWQQNQDRYSRDQDRDRYQREQNQSPRQQTARQSSDAIYQLDPEEWVRIGYDFDRDGRIDAVEDVVAFELQQLKARNEARRGSQQGSQSARDRWQWSRQQSDYQDRDDQGRQDMQSRQQEYWRGSPGYERRDMADAGMREPMQRGGQAEVPGQVLRRVQGTLTDLQSQDLTGQDKPHQLAKIETFQGLARVDLGPEASLQKLNLKEGDELAVVGTVGRINGRPVLMAHEVHSGDQTVQVERPLSAEMRRFKGTVEDYRNVAFEEQDEKQVVARVRLEDGRMATVNLGPEDKLKTANLQNGDEIQFLARPGEINGQAALIAEELRANNKNIEIQRPDKRQRFQEARAGIQQTQQPSSQRQPGQSSSQGEESATSQSETQPGQSPSQGQQDQEQQDSATSKSQSQQSQSPTQGQQNQPQQGQSPGADQSSATEGQSPQTTP